MYQDNRNFMKSQMSKEDLITTADIAKGIPQPIFEQNYTKDSDIIYLPKITVDNAPQTTFIMLSENEKAEEVIKSKYFHYRHFLLCKCL